MCNFSHTSVNRDPFKTHPSFNKSDIPLINNKLLNTRSYHGKAPHLSPVEIADTEKCYQYFDTKHKTQSKAHTAVIAFGPISSGRFCDRWCTIWKKWHVKIGVNQSLHHAAYLSENCQLSCWCICKPLWLCICRLRGQCCICWKKWHVKIGVNWGLHPQYTRRQTCGFTTSIYLYNICFLKY